MPVIWCNHNSNKKVKEIKYFLACLLACSRNIEFLTLRHGQDIDNIVWNYRAFEITHIIGWWAENAIIAIEMLFSIMRLVIMNLAYLEKIPMFKLWFPLGRRFTQLNCCTVGQNDMKLMHSTCKHTSISHEHRNEWASEKERHQFHSRSTHWVLPMLVFKTCNLPLYETEDDVNFNPRISSGQRPMAEFEAIREKTIDGWADGWTDKQSLL